VHRIATARNFDTARNRSREDLRKQKNFVKSKDLQNRAKAEIIAKSKKHYKSAS